MPVSALASVSDGRLPPAIIAPDGAVMKFFADFMPFSARYCDIAKAGAAAELWAKGYYSKQYLAEKRLFRLYLNRYYIYFISNMCNCVVNRYMVYLKNRL